MTAVKAPAMLTVGGVEALDWLPEELSAWRVPEVISSAEWAEKHVKISPRGAALPGTLNLDMTPYARGWFDALDDPLIDTITVIAASQMAKSMFLHAAMAAVTCQHPGPLLLVLPTEPDVREVAGTTLLDMVRECAPLMELSLSGEETLTKEGYWFSTANWYFGWSNSPASLARRACRYVFYDEVDKFPPYVGRESDPISLGDKRLRTFRNTTGVKSVRVTTPTTREGLGWREYELSDQRRFWIPCPVCGTYQVPTRSQMTWPHGADGRSESPDLIERLGLSRFVCRECKAEWKDEAKNAAARAGLWARKGETVGRDGKIAGEAEVLGSHAGFQVGALCSLFTTTSQLAASWLRATNSNDLVKLQDVINSELGEIWEETETVTEEAPMWTHRGEYKRGTAPAAVAALTAFVDVQKDHFYLSVWGWGYGLESWLIDWLPLESEESVHGYLAAKRFPRAAAPAGETPSAVKGQGGGPVVEAAMAISLTLIDSGDQTAMVYELCQKWRDIPIAPSKGEGVPGVPLRTTVITRNPRTGRRYPHSVIMYGYDANYWKDSTARRAAAATAGPGYMHLPADVDEEWIKQFASEHKIIDRHRRRGGRSNKRPTRTWVPKSSGRANHYWDCAVGAAVAAEILNLRNLPDPNAPQPKPVGRRMGQMDYYNRGQ